MMEQLKHKISNLGIDAMEDVSYWLKNRLLNMQTSMVEEPSSKYGTSKNAFESAIHELVQLPKQELMQMENWLQNELNKENGDTHESPLSNAQWQTIENREQALVKGTIRTIGFDELKTFLNERRKGFQTS